MREVTFEEKAEEETIDTRSALGVVAANVFFTATLLTMAALILYASWATFPWSVLVAAHALFTGGDPWRTIERRAKEVKGETNVPDV